MSGTNTLILLKSQHVLGFVPYFIAFRFCVPLDEAGLRHYIHWYITSVSFSHSLGPGTLPLLTLPYATYQAKSYDVNTDIYIFANIRFAAPPVGNLHWAPPAEPLTESGIQNGSIGGSCFQSAPLEVLIPLKLD